MGIQFDLAWHCLLCIPSPLFYIFLPDLILTPSLGRKSFLLGDAKFSVTTLHNRYIEDGDPTGQWKTFRKHAKGFQWIPINYFLTWSQGPRGQAKEKELIRESANKGVIMFITSLKQ
ncbi:MAG: hypothetical protein AAGA60_16995 [Cyanobacteria bacterium P01_E01_bin.42]